jgi:hypothetical protein
MVKQNSFNNTLVGDLKVALGGDATGDLYYRDSNGFFARLPIGTNGQNMSIIGGLPAWVNGSSPGGAAGGDLTGSYPNPTIAGNTVTFAKIQNISTAQILGRSTAGPGNIESLAAATVRTILGLGTAALVDTGTGSGQIPVLDANDWLPTSVIPPLRSHEFVSVANAAARLALTTAQVQPGDEAFEQDTLRTYKLISADPTVSGNWILIADIGIDASGIISGTIAASRLGSGTANASSYLRGDQTWAAVPSQSLPVVSVTGATAQLATDTSYHVNNASLVTLTMPTTASVGAVIEIIGVGAGGWRLTQNVSQQIFFGNSATTIGASGRIDSTHRRDCIRLVCVAENTDWEVFPAQGNLDVI